MKINTLICDMDVMYRWVCLDWDCTISALNVEEWSKCLCKVALGNVRAATETDIPLPLTEMLLSALISANCILVIVNHYFSVGRRIMIGILWKIHHHVFPTSYVNLLCGCCTRVASCCLLQLLSRRVEEGRKEKAGTRCGHMRQDKGKLY